MRRCCDTILSSWTTKTNYDIIMPRLVETFMDDVHVSTALLFVTCHYGFSSLTFTFYLFTHFQESPPFTHSVLGASCE